MILFIPASNSAAFAALPHKWKQPEAQYTRQTWMIKAWSDEAWEDFEYWMKQDKIG